MKYILFKRAFTTAFASLLVFSCNQKDDGSSYYTPETYVFNNDFEVAINSSSLTDTSAEVIYTPTAEGTGYIAVTRADQPAPTSTQIHNGKFGDILVSNYEKFDIKDTTPINITVDSLIYGDYNYNVYAINKTVDGFISEEPKLISFLTPDTQDPTFLKETSSPVHENDSADPIAEVVLDFSEPVFYQGGDITFTGTNSGRVITVNDEQAITSNGKTIVIKPHGTFPQNDQVKVSWAADTFKDKSGKSVAALADTYTFITRAFTIQEIAFLMQGTYNYQAQFSGMPNGLETIYDGLPAGQFPPKSGEIVLKLDESDPTKTTLIGLNIFNAAPAPEPKSFKMKIGENGKLIIPENVPSIITLSGFATEWGSPSVGLFLDAGTHDIDNGIIINKKALYLSNSTTIFDEIEYVYNRVGTYEKNSNSSDRKAEQKSFNDLSVKDFSIEY